jgi:hypothetical protein
MPDIAAPSDWFNVRPGDPAFIIGANACDWFDLGVREGTDYWLEGEIVNGTEFLFNGRLFLPTNDRVSTAQATTWYHGMVPFCLVIGSQVIWLQACKKRV